MGNSAELDVSALYTVDQNQNPLVTLLPNHTYTVKGDVYIYKEVNGTRTVDKIINNCYFFSEH
jgi:hypothetical protein